MNILFISPNSPEDSVGGVERYITNLIDYCNDNTKHKVILMLPTQEKSRIHEGKNIHIYFDHELALSKNSTHRRRNGALKAQTFSHSLQDIITRHHIDIICAENFHVGLPPAYSILLNMTAGLHNIPLVLRLHSFANSPLQTELINELMWKKVSCVSKSVAGDCFHKGADVDHLSTDYLGVNTTKFNMDEKADFDLKHELDIPADSKILLTATRIIRGKTNILAEKGIINLMQSFSKISPRYPDLRLLLAIGKPPLTLQQEFDQAFSMLLGYIKLHSIENKTIIKAFKLHEMPSVYKGSDIFVLPSENETFGQVFIESMACGLPVIGTKVGGIPEIISDSYNGYLINPGDSSLLAQRIETLLTNDETRNQFIKAGVSTVKDKFTAKNQFDAFFKKLEYIATQHEDTDKKMHQASHSETFQLE